jgi:hypothetical protein
MSKEWIELFVKEVKLDFAQEKRALKWFEKNPPEPIVVGLSDYQIDDIGKICLGVNSRCLRPSMGDYIQRIGEYVKSKTFAQLSEAIKAAMVEVDIRNQEIEKLNDDFIALESEYSKLKAQVATKNVSEIVKASDGIEVEGIDLYETCESLKKSRAAIARATN